MLKSLKLVLLLLIGTLLTACPPVPNPPDPLTKEYINGIKNEVERVRTINKYCKSINIPDSENEITDTIKRDLIKQNKLLTKADLKLGLDTKRTLDHCDTQFTAYIREDACKPFIRKSCNDENTAQKNMCLEFCTGGILKKCEAKVFPEFIAIMTKCNITKYKNGKIVLIGASETVSVETKEETAPATQ